MRLAAAPRPTRALTPFTGRRWAPTASRRVVRGLSMDLVGCLDTVRAAAAALDERASLRAELWAREELERRAARPGGTGVPGRSLEAFLFRYLPDAFDQAPGEFHRGIYADLDRMVMGEPIEGRTVREAAMAYPRGHGKTTTITLGFAAWVLYNWREMPFFRGKAPFILLVSDSLDQARDRSLDLRDQVSENEELEADYGRLAPSPAEIRRRNNGAKGRRKLKWTETDWTTADGVRVKAVGSRGKVRGLLRSGQRPSLILIDDLEGDTAVETELQRAKLERWLTRALLPTGLPGRCLTVAVGTVLHGDSLLSRLLRPDMNEDWLKRRFAACYMDDGLTPAHPTPHGPGTRPLWPEFWTLELLAEKWRSLRSLAFAQEYLNQPIDDENSPFKWEWLAKALENGAGIPFAYAPPEQLGWDEVTGAWDLTGHPDALTHYQMILTAFDLALIEDEKQAQARDSDYVAGITVALRCDDTVEVRRVYHKRGMTPDQLRKRIVTEHEITGSQYTVIENNAAQRIVEWDVKTLGVRVVGHSTDRKKRTLYEGVPAMAYTFETQRIRLCHNSAQERTVMERLCRELHGLGIEAHDDLVMSLWMALRVLSRIMRRRDAERLKRLGPRTVMLPTGPSGIFPEADTTPRVRGRRQ